MENAAYRQRRTVDFSEPQITYQLQKAAFRRHLHYKVLAWSSNLDEIQVSATLFSPKISKKSRLPFICVTIYCILEAFTDPITEQCGTPLIHQGAIVDFILLRVTES